MACAAGAISKILTLQAKIFVSATCGPVVLLGPHHAQQGGAER
jgi:hypothetical protein